MFKKLLKTKTFWSGLGMLATAGALYAVGDIPGAAKALEPLVLGLSGLAVLFIREAILKVDEKVTKQGERKDDPGNTTNTNTR